MHALRTWLACWVLILTPLYAQEAQLSLQPLSEGPHVQGDTVSVGLYVDVGSISLTSASVYLHVDTSQWQVVYPDENESGYGAPFSRGTAWETTVYENRYDAETGQLSYVAVGGMAAGGQRQVGRGRFLLASVRMRIVDYPEGGRAALWIDAAGQRQPVYTRAGQPGVKHRFRPVETALWIGIDQEGFERIPDRTESIGSEWQVDLASYYSNVSNEVISWGARSEGEIALDSDGSLVTGVTLGEGSVHYWAERRDGVRHEGAFTVRVQPTTPYLREGGTLEVVEDGGVYRFPLEDFLFNSAQEGHFSMRADGPVVARIAGDLLEVEPAADAVGHGLLSLGFCSVDGRCESVEWQVLILPVNDPPVLHLLPSLAIAVGERYTIPLSRIVGDVDDELSQLRFEARQTASVNIYQDGENIVVEGLAEGSEELVVQVVDRLGAVGEEIWVIRVVGPSVGPEWKMVPQLQLSVDEALRVDLTAYVIDADTPVAQLEWSLRGDGIDIIWEEGNQSSVYLSSRQAGEAILYIQVRDPEGNQAVTTWPIRINQAVSEEGDGIETVGIEGGPDGRIASQEEGGGMAGEAGGELDESASVEVDESVGSTPSAGQETAGVEGEGATHDEAVEAQVEDRESSNTALTWSLLEMEPKQMMAGTENIFDLSLFVQGIDGRQLVWEVQSGAGLWVDIEDTWAVVRVNASFSGQTSVVFIASDKEGLQHSTHLSLEVYPTEQSWTLSDIPDVAFVEGDSLLINLSSYVDGPVSWSSAGGEGLFVDWVGGGVVLSAASGFIGRSVMIFTAKAADGSQAADIVRVDVVESEKKGEELTDDQVDTGPRSEELGELTLRTWDDIILFVGDVKTTQSLDELVVEGDPSLVEWSLRGGVFISAQIESDDRIRLDGRSARVGREVFWLTALRGGLQREVSLGIQVRVRPLVLRVPEEEVIVGSEGFDLSQLVEGNAVDVQWSVAQAEGMRIENERLYVNAPPGEYAVLLTAQRGSIAPVEISLTVRVQAVELSPPEEGGDSLPEEEGQEEVVQGEELPPPQWAMPDLLAVEAGQSGRWPLRVEEGHRLATDLSFILLSENENAFIERGDLVVVNVRAPMVVALLVIDGHGQEDRVEISVMPIDSRPPKVELQGVYAGEGGVRWTVVGDEKLGAATLLLDNVPLVPIERSARTITWQHQGKDAHLGHLRALIADESGNLTQVEQTFRTGVIGGGHVMESADGVLRVLKGGAVVPLLIYRRNQAYRIEYAGRQEVEIALVAPEAGRVLEFGQEGLLRPLPTIQADGRLRGRVRGSGWLSTAKGVAQMAMPLEPYCFPNPFNAAVTIGLDMSQSGWLQVDVFDLLGRPVRQLLSEQRSSGPWHVAWDGRDDKGRDAASGPYFIAVQAAGRRYTTRVLLLR